MSAKYVVNDVSVDIGQAIVATLKTVGQVLVVDAHAMQQRRVEIVDVNRILRDIVAVVVGFAVTNAGFDAATRHPDGKATRMVVASK